MKRREFLFSLAGAMAASGSLRAQQKAMPVIGYLHYASSTMRRPARMPRMWSHFTRD
jgi:hypothetical protein